MAPFAKSQQDAYPNGGGDSGGSGFTFSALRHVGTRSLRLKISWVALFGVFVVFMIWRSSSISGLGEIYGNHPTKPKTLLSEDALPPISNSTPTHGVDGSIQGGAAGRFNTSFHLLIRKRPNREGRTPGLCRTILTALTMDYPPPTLIDSESANSSVAAIDGYLSSNSRRMKDDDVVLIIDEVDVWLQLPPDLLLRRFYTKLIADNKRLRKKYGFHYSPTEDKEWSQVYSERIIFGADKVCRVGESYNSTCSTVPHSPLMPDIYGKYTDDGTYTSDFRPRWLNSGAVMGLAADVRLLYRYASSVADPSTHEQNLLGEIYGEQEYVRELYHTTRKSWLTRLAEVMGIYNRVELPDEGDIEISPGRRYEYGIGLDYRSELFFTMFESDNDAQFLKYNDVPMLSEVQRKHRVPRESRLILPDDVALLPNPFPPHPNNTNETEAPTPTLSLAASGTGTAAGTATGTATLSGEPSATTSASLDNLPNPLNKSWHNLPLMTNVRTASIPALLHFNGSHPEPTGRRWRAMWFHPWARALLRKYLRATQEIPAAASSLQGHAWDTRGGRGGVWTTRNEWKSWPEICKGSEDPVFSDGRGLWGKEDGVDREAPVYNKWGMLISGQPH